MTQQYHFRFLGVGNARAAELGSASAVLERNGEPLLLIDCGPHTLDDYARHYAGRLPSAVFISHLHLDHIGGVEQLFYRSFFPQPANIRLFVPSHLIVALHQKLANSPFVLSEGGANFWDAFRLVPVQDHFWLENLLFSVFPVRHSGYLAAFGVALPGAFLYSGDTRPIPEILASFAAAGETIFHDCAEHGSPAHCGAADLKREYDNEQLARIVAYHYESAAAGARLVAQGFKVAKPGEAFPLKAPAPIIGTGVLA